MSIRLQQFAEGKDPKMAERRPPGRSCVFCGGPMFLDGDRWTCSACNWQMPNRELCPRCWAPLPEEEGEGGEKVCVNCGYEFWPPRDGLPEPREVWYHPPGMEPYKVRGGTQVLPSGPAKGGGGSKPKSKRKSDLQRRFDEWKRKNPMRRKGM